MKKLIFVGVMILGFVVSYTSSVPEFLQKQVQSLSGMSRSEFDTYINKKHYLVKAWAVDPKKMDPKTYKALYETLNYQETILNFIKGKTK